MTHTSLNSNHKATKTAIKVPNGFQYYEKAPSSSNNPYAKFYHQNVPPDISNNFDIKKNAHKQF